MKRSSNNIYWRANIGPTEEIVQSDMMKPEDWFELWTDKTASKSSTWWNALDLAPTGTFNRAKKIAADLYTKAKDKRSTPYGFDTSIKACAPIREYLNRCLVLKAPCDLHFSCIPSSLLPENQELAKQDDWVEYKTWILKAADSRFDQMTPAHSPKQYTAKKDPLFKDMSNLKIQTEIALSLPDGMTSSFHPPFYHWPDAPFIQMPGVHSNGLEKCVNLIWNVMIPDYIDDFEIKAGDAMMYVFFSEKPGKFIKHPNPSRAQIFKRKMFAAGTSVEKLVNDIQRKKKE